MCVFGVFTQNFSPISFVTHILFIRVGLTNEPFESCLMFHKADYMLNRWKCYVFGYLLV